MGEGSAPGRDLRAGHEFIRPRKKPSAGGCRSRDEAGRETAGQIPGWHWNRKRQGYPGRAFSGRQDPLPAAVGGHLPSGLTSINAPAGACVIVLTRGFPERAPGPAQHTRPLQPGFVRKASLVQSSAPPISGGSLISALQREMPAAVRHRARDLCSAPLRSLRYCWQVMLRHPTPGSQPLPW